LVSKGGRASTIIGAESALNRRCGSAEKLEIGKEADFFSDSIGFSVSME
jgi:hypothetical protein